MYDNEKSNNNEFCNLCMKLMQDIMEDVSAKNNIEEDINKMVRETRI